LPGATQYFVDKTVHRIVDQMAPSMLQLSESELNEPGFDRKWKVFKAVTARKLKDELVRPSIPAHAKPFEMHMAGEHVIKSLEKKERWFWEAVCDFFEPVAQVFVAVAETVVEVFETVVEIVVEAVKTVVDIIVEVATFIGEAVHALGKFLYELVKNMIEFIADLIAFFAAWDCEISADTADELFGPSEGPGGLLGLMSYAADEFMGINSLVEDAHNKDKAGDVTKLDSGMVVFATAACGVVWGMIEATFPMIGRATNWLKHAGEQCPMLKCEPNKDGKEVCKGMDFRNMAITIGGTIGAGVHVGLGAVSIGGGAGLEVGVGLSARGQQMCYVGGCVQAEVGLGVTAGVSAGLEIGAALTLFKDASGIPGTCSSIGVSGDFKLVMGFGFGGSFGCAMLLPDYIDIATGNSDASTKELSVDDAIRKMAELLAVQVFFGVEIAAGGQLDVKVTIFSGLCWTPICLTSTGKQCGVKAKDANQCSEAQTLTDHSGEDGADDGDFCECLPCNNVDGSVELWSVDAPTRGAHTQHSAATLRNGVGVQWTTADTFPPDFPGGYASAQGAQKKTMAKLPYKITNIKDADPSMAKGKLLFTHAWMADGSDATWKDVLTENTGRGGEAMTKYMVDKKGLTPGLDARLMGLSSFKIGRYRTYQVEVFAAPPGPMSGLTLGTSVAEQYEICDDGCDLDGFKMLRFDPHFEGRVCPPPLETNSHDSSKICGPRIGKTSETGMCYSNTDKGCVCSTFQKVKSDVGEDMCESDWHVEEEDWTEAAVFWSMERGENVEKIAPLFHSLEKSSTMEANELSRVKKHGPTSMIYMEGQKRVAQKQKKQAAFERAIARAKDEVGFKTKNLNQIEGTLEDLEVEVNALLPTRR